MRLTDKVAIITGGGQGLGREFALACSKEGAKVVIAEINADKARAVAREVESNGGEALALPTDVTSIRDTRDMARRTIERFGRIDILVNNAAIYYGLQMKPFTEIGLEEWDKMMTVNVKGMWLCCAAVFPQMRQQGKGKIINIASSVFNHGVPFMLHYVTSKGAVVGLTRALAREVGEAGITVNCINPGFTWTEASETVSRSAPPRFAEMVESMQIIKRREQPSDIAGALIFLASNESDFITGQSCLIDGGINLQ